MVAIALVTSVVVTNIYAKKDSAARVPRWCVAAVFSPTGNVTVDDIVKKNRNKLEELPEIDRQKSVTSADNDEEWKQVAKFVDRVCFWVYIALTLCLLLVFLLQVD